MADPRYEESVNGLTPERLAGTMEAAMTMLRPLYPPRTGLCVLAFDFGEGGGMGYISNGRREDMIRAMEELVARLKKERA